MTDEISGLASILNFDPFTWQGIATSLLCGTIVGAERQMRGKPVGIRTATLITLGTYAFIVCALSIRSDMTDPSRIIGQVITGIGFLGAGVMLTRRGVVFGVTSAATIWCMASVGVCIAIGEQGTAIKLSIVVVVVLAGVDLLEDYMLKISNGVNSRFKKWRNPEE
jgi:putative Mg2+ transporter-C (MgtC) family protein